MTSKELNDTIARYSERFKNYGYGPEALGWGKKDRSTLRFEILSSYWKLEGKAVLDVGCGFGDLYGYLKERGIAPRKYVGVDINADLIKEGKRHYPDADLRIENVIDDGIAEQFDIVLSSGIFNHKLEDNRGFIRKALTRFNEISNQGFCCNFLSNKVDFTYEHTFHSDPCEILELAYNFSRRVVLRNDYMPFEFSIFVDKHEEVDPKLTIYSNPSGL